MHDPPLPAARDRQSQLVPRRGRNAHQRLLAFPRAADARRAVGPARAACAGGGYDLRSGATRAATRDKLTPLENPEAVILSRTRRRIWPRTTAPFDHSERRFPSMPDPSASTPQDDNPAEPSMQKISRAFLAVIVVTSSLIVRS